MTQKEFDDKLNQLSEIHERKAFAERMIKIVNDYKLRLAYEGVKYKQSLHIVIETHYAGYSDKGKSIELDDQKFVKIMTHIIENHFLAEQQKINNEIEKL